MCGAPKEQVITQKTELQPGLLRHYYGGTLADPRGGFANGGPVGGITSINPPQAPMMGGGLANLLSDPMMAAALSSTVRSPEIRYGQLGANPMASQTIDRAIQGYAQGGYIQGPGTGRSDSIPAKIYQDGIPVQEARLSDGEFVMTENAVRGAGNGDPKAGAARMYEMMRKFERGGMA
jgi:hypothetical protein